MCPEQGPRQPISSGKLLKRGEVEPATHFSVDTRPHKTAYNVVFTCLESVDYDEVKRRHIGPDIQGRQLKERLTSYFDEVFYMTTRPDADGIDRRVFYTQPRPGIPAKDRSGQLDEIEQPNLAAIKAKILGDQT